MHVIIYIHVSLNIMTYLVHVIVDIHVSAYIITYLNMDIHVSFGINGI